MAMVNDLNSYQIGPTKITIDATTQWLVGNVLDDIGHIGVGQNSRDALLIAYIYKYGTDIGEDIDGEFRSEIQDWYDEKKTERRREYKNGD